MKKKVDASTKHPRHSRWSQYLIYAVAIILFLFGALRMSWFRWIDVGSGAITGEIMPELVACERIELEPAALRGWNVLLITTDTTRADHLACYGNRGIETPVLDELARSGVLCAQAVTPSPATLPGHSSLLTGLYPFNHGARANGTFKLDEKNVTLAEVLKEQGYRTGAAISAFVLDGQFGTNQGFDEYHDDLTMGVKHAPQMFRERPAELTNVAVKAWLKDNANQRFFYWAHFFDPHATYLPPEPFRSKYSQNLYDGEIAYVDSQIGDLLSYLDELGIRDHTLVIVTADHGEGLGEHGEQTHSLLIYDGTLHVPMIFSAPGAIPGGKVLQSQVSLVDVMPTLLEMLGVHPPGNLDGRSLLQAAPSTPRPVYVETLSTMTLHGWAPLLGVRRDDYKFILAPEPELYDLRADPHELDNLYESHSDPAMDLRAELITFVGEDPWLAARATQNAELKPDAIRRLEALGYVSSTPTDDGPADSLEQLPDPKEMIYHWEDVQKAVAMRNLGDIAGAIKQLTACVESVPRDVFAMQILGGAYAAHGEPDKALETFLRALELSPNDTGLYMGVANMYMTLGRLEKAHETAKRVQELDPEHGDVYVLLGRLAWYQNNEDEAFALLARAVELDPGSAGPHACNLRGEIHFQAARFEQARAAFGRTIEIDGLNGDAHDGLARILIQEGNYEDAKRELGLALRFQPANARALATLGGILSDEGEYDNALTLLGRALEMNPRFGYALNNLALTYRRQEKLELAEEKYEEAIECNPRLDLPYVNLAQLYLMQGREDDAIARFRQAIRVNPSNAIALTNVGTYYLRDGRVEDACALLRRAVRVKPDYALAHKHLGAALLDMGQTQAAMTHLRTSLELDPTQADAGQMRFQLGVIESGERP